METNDTQTDRQTEQVTARYSVSILIPNHNIEQRRIDQPLLYCTYLTNVQKQITYYHLIGKTLTHI